MKVASLAEVRNNFSQFLTLSEKEPIFVTRNGSITAVLEHITDVEMEDYLLERNQRFRKALDASKKAKGGISLQAYRKSRKV
jgi:PHD/YefM family antitoxin component YafN of YafNO toxin-antitoxin module